MCEKWRRHLQYLKDQKWNQLLFLLFPAKGEGKNTHIQDILIPSQIGSHYECSPSSDGDLKVTKGVLFPLYGNFANQGPPK